jgi:hypothetical protein
LTHAPIGGGWKNRPMVGAAITSLYRRLGGR